MNLVNRLRNGSQVPASDRAFFDARPECLQFLFDYGSEAMLRSTQGVIADIRCLATPMDLDPAPVDVPVVVWHGEQDTLVQPEELLRYLEEPPWHSPEKVHVVPGAGTSLSLQIQADIMSALAGQNLEYYRQATA